MFRQHTDTFQKLTAMPQPEVPFDKNYSSPLLGKHIHITRMPHGAALLGNLRQAIEASQRMVVSQGIPQDVPDSRQSVLADVQKKLLQLYSEYTEVINGL